MLLPQPRAGSEGQSSLISARLPWKFSSSKSINLLRPWSCGRDGHGFGTATLARGGLRGSPRGGSRGGGTHGAGDGAEGAHPFHVVGVAAAPRLPARVLAALQHELLPLEAAVLEACPPAGAGGVRPPPHSQPGCARCAQRCPQEAARVAKGSVEASMLQPPCYPRGPAAPWGGSAPGPPLTPRSRSCRSGRC